MGFVLGNNMGLREELSMLEHCWMENQVIILGNEVADIITAT